MAQPVWVLSVDLQAKTATFQTGLADAARSARDSFKQVNQGASEMGESVGRGSLDVRHALGLVDNTIRGAHSMAMVDLIRMFKDSALVMGALPFAMTAAGFALVAEAVVKGVQAYEEYKQAQEKLKDDSTSFHTTIQEGFNALNDKILEAEKQTDTLRNDHLGALNKELVLIDHQSLSELAHQFETVARAADEAFGDIKNSWYEMSMGTSGAQHAFHEFRIEYQSLLAQHKDKEASNLLSGTLLAAQHILAMMQMVRADSAALHSGKSLSPVEQMAGVEALNDLKAAQVGWDDKDLARQQLIVEALSSQVGFQQRANVLKSDEKTNVSLQTDKDIKSDAQRLADSEREGREEYIREILETAKEAREVYEKSIQDLVGSTKEGSQERLEAIEQGMHEEEEAGLEDTEFYQRLVNEKLQAVEQMEDAAKKAALETAEAQARAREQMAQEEGRHQAQMLQLKQTQGSPGDYARLALEREQLDIEYQLKREAMQKQLQLYREAGADEVKQAQQTEQQLELLDKEHADRTAELQQQQAQAIRGSLAQVETSYATTFMSIMEGHQRLSQTMIRLADQGMDSMIKASIQLMNHNKAEQLSSAKTAAAGAYKAMAPIPYVGPALGAIAAAAVFAGAMAFQDGTDMVPGIGRGDKVPAMLEPGEGVVPGGVMDGLRNVARNGGFEEQRPHNHVNMHVHMHASALDSDGLDTVLKKNADTLQRHFENTVRRMNR
jgi:uncharacterized protein YdcH (DUF465 family)